MKTLGSIIIIFGLLSANRGLIQGRIIGCGKFFSHLEVIPQNIGVDLLVMNKTVFCGSTVTRCG